jgi:hypothetical protein
MPEAFSVVKESFGLRPTKPEDNEFVNSYKKSIFVTYLEIISLHLKTISPNISSKKPYSKPEVSRIALDYSISLVMMTDIPPNPDPQGSGKKGNDSPFQSPFGDKPFG